MSAVSRAVGAHRSTVREWRDVPRKAALLGECPHCDGADLDPSAYAALLGYYLGDGCLSEATRYWFLRVTCDDAYPAIIDDVREVIARVRPGGRTFLVPKAGCHDVHSNWVHWRCLFPQHGPGRKHERTIRLEGWQREIVLQDPAAFLRGLFHSDGARVTNSTTKTVAGETKRFVYPRWQFVNASDDIRGLCTWALDLVEVAWRQSNTRTISVSRREAVARLDELIGPKT